MLFSKNKSGFSLAEVLVAAGILSGLSLVMMRLSSSQAVTEKRAQSSFEINTISSAITQSLLNQKACSDTIGVGATVSNNMTIPSIRNRQGNVQFRTGSIYGDRQVKISAINLKYIGTPTVDGSYKYADTNLIVEFTKMSNLIKGSKTLTRNFPVRIEMDSTDKLIKCYSQVENAVDTSTEKSCTNIGGTYEVTSGRCYLKEFNTSDPTLNISSRDVAVSTKYLNDSLSSYYLPQYVRITGDIMTGELEVEAPIKTNDSVCINGKCRTNFSEQSCPIGKVIAKVNEDGTIVCNDVTCSNPTEYYVGVDASGNAICKPMPTKTCPTNQYVSKVLTNGNIECSNLPPENNKICPTNKVLKVINASGTYQCVDNLPKINCRAGSYISRILPDGTYQCNSVPDPFPFSQECISGKIMTGLDQNGRIICSEPASETRYKDACFVKVLGKSCPAGTVLHTLFKYRIRNWLRRYGDAGTNKARHDSLFGIEIKGCCFD